MRVDKLTKAQAASIADYLRPPYRMIWEIGITTGLRISDILQLTYRQIRRRDIKIRERKTGKIRRIYIRKHIAQDINLYCTRHKIIDDDRVFSVSRQQVWRALKRAAARAGIDVNIGSHTMRKTYSALYIQSGHSIRDLQQRLNHDNITDTINYLLSNNEIGGSKT